MYDPLLGKFISVDPIMDLTDPQQWNGYAYSHNNPTTFTDPTGMRELCEKGYSCNYGTGGSITKAKKKPKRKPTINDQRSQWRTNYWAPSFASANTVVGFSGGAVSMQHTYERRLDAKLRAQSAPPPALNNTHAYGDLYNNASERNYWNNCSKITGTGTGPRSVPGNMASSMYDGGLKNGGRLLGVVGVGLTINEDIRDGGGDRQLTGELIAVDLAAIGAGAVLGAAVGSFIPVPGVGTALGALAGASIVLGAGLVAAGFSYGVSYYAREAVLDRHGVGTRP